MSRSQHSSAMSESLSHSSSGTEPPEAHTSSQQNPSLNSSSTAEDGNTDPAVPNLTRSRSMVREIYKNSWLKLIPCADKWSGRIYKAQKPEKHWVVFCVHDEKDAFLEFYENRRSAYSHNPTSSVSLAECLHVSPTIVVQDNDYEFVITLETKVIRLAASTREQMVEWMDTLRNKLRDLSVLEPKDNLYSREPIIDTKVTSPLNESTVLLDNQPHDVENLSSQLENSLSRVSLRDPNSPLPPVPSVTPHSSGDSTTTVVRSSSVEDPEPSTSSSQVNLLLRSSSEDHPHNVTPTTTSENPTTSVPTNGGIYEPLFRMTTIQQNSNPAIRNPSYENRPSSESVPALPPKVNSESRRLLSSNARAQRSNSERSQVPVSQEQRRTSREDGQSHVNPIRTNITQSSSQSSEDLVTNNSISPRSRNSAPVEAVPQTDENGRILSLREAQVLKLQAEILHKSGVRLVLRKKDCVNAVAFVDCFGSVWVAGWKQKEHPLLHNTFHIGDKIFSVSGHKVHSVQEVLKIIKLQHVIVDFVVCRTPCAKVLAIKKEYEGQDLGLVREGGTAEIKEVKAGGLALRYGLPPKASSIDGNSLCNWCLTEINHRPLNLFFKENEVHDRLNAVGLDISILVQPIELVKALKKQLKTIRGYKDYTLQ